MDGFPLASSPDKKTITVLRRSFRALRLPLVGLPHFCGDYASSRIYVFINVQTHTRIYIYIYLQPYLASTELDD